MRVAVAMSGGVDSSVAAALLVEGGHEVVGATLGLGCGGDPAGLADARAVAGALGIPHHVVDGAREFEERVLRPAWDEYDCGRTPSPCLVCNERIKFGLLLDWARSLGIDHVATGHHARLEVGDDGEIRLLRGADRDKDQSYFLARLSREQLASAVFPVGGMHKADVRAHARRLGLPSAERAESQDACLVAEGQSFPEMLRSRFGATAAPGDVVDDDGRTIGRHAGVHLYTVGQRRGLGVASASRMWVRAVHCGSAEVVVTHDEGRLLSDRMAVDGVRWLAPRPAGSVVCEVQVRYRHAPVRAEVRATATDEAEVTFERPVRAVAPGQAAVFYDGERVLGSGWIRSAF
jgi:tRNA-uridine 2-sulfurtransferase